MEDGSSIRGSLISTYERIVRHCCAELWSFKIKPEHEGYVQNYSFWKGKYLWLLQRIAKRIKARCPEISWCTDHYKAFKWIEMHVKSECGKRAVVLRDAEKRKAEAGSSSSNKKAKKNNHISNSKVGSDSLSGISSKKVAPLDDNDTLDDAELSETFSLDDEVMTKKASSSKVSSTSKPSTAASTSKHAAGYPRKSLGVPANPSTSMKTQISIPTRPNPRVVAPLNPLLSTQASIEEHIPVVSKLNAAVTSMASTSASSLLPATVSGIRAALATRFSSLAELDVV
ncbi:hypothetical protein A4X13_0g9616, partial [Tilletia indica]